VPTLWGARLEGSHKKRGGHQNPAAYTPVAWVFGPQRSWVDVCNKCQVYIHPTDSKIYRLWIWRSGQASTRISCPSQSRIPHPHKRFLFSDPTTVVWCIAGGNLPTHYHRCTTHSVDDTASPAQYKGNS
jgi:hypothetical protein